MNQIITEHYSECSNYEAIETNQELELIYNTLESESEIDCDSCLHYNNGCQIFKQQNPV